MLKRYLVLLIISIIPFSAQGGFWSDIANCLSDPCNCGGGDQVEQWDGRELNWGPENNLCPPWNKGGGRDSHMCIDNEGYPDVFIPWYLKHCAEETPESNYFAPKIRIRNQTCNSFACWTLDETLNWDGECVVWPTPWGLPLLRICARVAVPQDNVRGLPADPGYTFRQHLNFEGAVKPDEPYVGVDKQPVYIDGPKLCAYRDPSAIDIISVSGINIDIMDWNPTHQSIHKSQGLHPVARVILMFLNFVTQTGQSLNQMIAMLLDQLGGLIIPGFDVFRPIIEAFGKLFELFASVIEAIIREFGQFNRVVDDYNFGCVNIPLGPMPPPFCPTLAGLVPGVSTQEVCRTQSDGTAAPSNKDVPCVVSKLRNNSIKNTIRITYDDFVPLCRNGEDPTKTNKCVTLSNLGAFSSASAMHTATARRDAIKPCSSAPSGAPCVNTMIPFQCDISSNGCEDGFRVVYGLKVGTKLIPSGYFYEFFDGKNTQSMPDCSGSQNINCQEIWGINKGQFVDVSLEFPQVQAAGDLSPLTQDVSLKDSNGTNRSFKASLLRVPAQVGDIKQTNKQICVFENNTELVSCQNRATPLKPRVYDCSSGLSGLSCNNDYFTPAFIASLDDGVDFTRAVVQPLTVQDPSSTSYKANLAAYDFVSFVTDQNFLTKPFSGPHSPNPASIYGYYVSNNANYNPIVDPNLVPYDSNGNTNTNVSYVRGLEYINDKYIQGGYYACLRTDTIDKCPINPKLCVLTTLQNNQYVDCTVFSAKASTYTGLRLCRPSDSNCINKDTLPGKNGNPNLNIKKCDNNVYCYDGSQEICILTTNPAHRNTPDASLGATLQDSQYYDINGTPGVQYDKSLYALRDKTPVEMGMCVSLAQYVCVSPNWGSASIGEMMPNTLACPPGQIRAGGNYAYCASNAANRSYGIVPSSTTFCYTPAPPP